jgi:hypothetical protein
LRIWNSIKSSRARDQERQRLVGIETRGRGSLRNKALEVLVGTDLRRDRPLDPARHFGPDEKWYANGETLGHIHCPVLCHVRQSGPAIGDRNFAAQLFDRAEAIEVRPICERRQIECGGKLAVHDRLALRADEPEVVTGSADRSWAVRAGGAAESANAKLSAYRTAADGEARFQQISALHHRATSPRHRFTSSAHV